MRHDSCSRAPSLYRPLLCVLITRGQRDDRESDNRPSPWTLTRDGTEPGGSQLGPSETGERREVTRRGSSVRSTRNTLGSGPNRITGVCDRQRHPVQAARSAGHPVRELAEGSDCECDHFPRFGTIGPLVRLDTAPDRGLRSVSASGGAATQQIARRRAPRPAAGPPTRAIAGARARAVTMATMRPPKHLNSRGQRLMFTEMEDQPRAARRADDKARVLFFRYCCHAARPLVLLAPFPILRASSP